SISRNHFIRRRFFVPTQQPVSASFTTTLGVRLKVPVTPRGSSESGRGQPHSKTLRADSEISNIRQVLECGCPLPLLYRCGCATVLNRTPTLVAACPRCAVSQGFQPADRGTYLSPRYYSQLSDWKSAIQQIGKSALLSNALFGLTPSPRKLACS